MYDLPYHKEPDEEIIRQFIRDHPFALVSGVDAQHRPVATQVPVLMEERDGRYVLRGHIMRNTDHHGAFAANENVLVVFMGKHAYVSGSWYRDPHTPSTWNYMSVHARGTIRLLDGAAIDEVLREASLHFEGQDGASATIFDNLPPDLRARLTKAILAFEIHVTDIDTVFKLSQDRDRDSYMKIMEKLKEKGSDGKTVAAEMEKRMSRVFATDELA